MIAMELKYMKESFSHMTRCLSDISMSSREVIVEIMKINASKDNLLYDNFFEVIDCSTYCNNNPDCLCWLCWMLATDRGAYSPRSGTTHDGNAKEFHLFLLDMQCLWTGTSICLT